MTPPDYEEMAKKLYSLARNDRRNPNFVIDVIKENLMHAQTVGKTMATENIEGLSKNALLFSLRLRLHNVEEWLVIDSVPVVKKAELRGRAYQLKQVIEEIERT